jgi:hypothetical protein
MLGVPRICGLFSVLALMTAVGCGAQGATGRSPANPVASVRTESGSRADPGITLKAFTAQALLDRFAIRLDPSVDPPRITQRAAEAIATAMFGSNPIVDAVYADCVQEAGDPTERRAPCWFVTFDPESDTIAPSGPIQKRDREPVAVFYEFALVDPTSGERSFAATGSCS